MKAYLVVQKQSEGQEEDGVEGERKKRRRNGAIILFLLLGT